MHSESWSGIVDKSTWGEGPWVGEGDKSQWVPHRNGRDYPCLIVRHPRHGHWCGYVGVPPEHMFCNQNPEEDLSIEVHGGITYWRLDTETGFDPNIPGEGIGVQKEGGEFPRIRWIGFDCGHHLDISPGIEARQRAAGLPTLREDSRTSYRGTLYVIGQVGYLAEQLARRPITEPEKELLPTPVILPTRRKIVLFKNRDRP